MCITRLLNCGRTQQRSRQESSFILLCADFPVNPEASSACGLRGRMS